MVVKSHLPWVHTLYYLENFSSLANLGNKAITDDYSACVYPYEMAFYSLIQNEFCIFFLIVYEHPWCASLFFRLCRKEKKTHFACAFNVTYFCLSTTGNNYVHIGEKCMYESAGNCNELLSLFIFFKFTVKLQQWEIFFLFIRW